MQNRQSFQGWWDHFRQLNGITMRILSTIPTDKLDSRPIANMRTPKELAVHVYGQVVKNTTLGISTGEIVSFDEKTAVASIKSSDDLLKFCRDCWTAGDNAAKSVTDAQLQATVKTPWDMSLPGFGAAGIINDEYLHHRGQLYAYTRALGIEPPMMWDFEHNEAAFAPKVAAKV
jgi:uncharacterized damage-inducible protein DinB